MGSFFYCTNSLQKWCDTVLKWNKDIFRFYTKMFVWLKNWIMCQLFAQLYVFFLCVIINIIIIVFLKHSSSSSCSIPTFSRLCWWMTAEVNTPQWDSLTRRASSSSHALIGHTLREEPKPPPLLLLLCSENGRQVF